MALSDKKILEEMKKGDIVISPFVRENLATSSYDVTLGEYFFPQRSPKHFQHIYNIYDKSHVERVWGTKPLKAEKAKEIFKHYKFDFTGIDPEDKIIVLEPGETILAHTNEFIGGKNHITTMMKARSSLGRSFIEVCKCAGWGDVGYVNRWTMEITNNSMHYAIPLVVGRRIAQLVFFETGPIDGADYNVKGKYNASTDLKTLKKDWNPEMMLPRLWSDRDIKKKK
ncbi:MAG: deoxycytidine triphosphate deaminase [Patescibacteria group bacterium]